MAFVWLALLLIVEIKQRLKCLGKMKMPCNVPGSIFPNTSLISNLWWELKYQSHPYLSLLTEDISSPGCSRVPLEKAAGKSVYISQLVAFQEKNYIQENIWD